jgi:Ion transport protein
VPCTRDKIPPSAYEEYMLIFSDIDFTNTGFITREEVTAALSLNNIDLGSTDRVNSFLDAMDSLNNNRIRAEPFACCLYALSLQYQESLNPMHYAVFPDSDIKLEVSNIWLRRRRAALRLLEEPNTSILAGVIGAFIIATILLSTFSFILETYPLYYSTSSEIFFWIEIGSTIVFSIELFLRFALTTNKRTFFLQPLNLIDLLAIIPCYIELMVSTSGTGASAGVLRAVRLFRIFRLMKISRYITWMRVFGRTLGLSMPPLGMIFVMTSISVVVFSTIEYYWERGTWNAATMTWMNDIDGTPSLFSSIPATFWWCIVSMTTVGYGDMVPTTNMGRFIAVIAFFIGIMLLAIPISVVSGNFHTEYKRMDNLRRIRAEHSAGKAWKPIVTSSDYLTRSVSNDESVAPLSVSGDQSSSSAQVDVGTHLPLGSQDSSFELLNDQTDPTTDSDLSKNWAAPFLRSCLQIIRASRRKLSASLKQAELVNKSDFADQLGSLLTSLSSEDRVGAIFSSQS